MTEADIDVNETFPIIEGVYTSVLKCGGVGPRSLLALIIPGNPGVSHYYAEFMKVLYQESDRKIPAWCISHAGHGKTPHRQEKIGPTVRDVYGVKGQIQHKLSFIKDHVPQNTQLILIGHSIGCYIILHMLSALEPSRIVKCLFLFPTIERMALSPKGRIVTPPLKYLSWISAYVTLVLDIIPETIKEKLIKWYFGDRGVPLCAIEGTKRVANARSVSKSLYMANQEMKMVQEADHDLIRRNLSKLLFYYGATDHWCPVDYFHDMKNLYPEGDIILCEQGYAHAFVLESSKEVAKVMWKWLQDHPGIAMCEMSN